MKPVFLIPALFTFLVAAGSSDTARTASAVPAGSRFASSPVKAGEEDVQRAEVSQLVLVRLPGSALRSTSKPDLAKFTEAFQQMAQAKQSAVVKTEVLIWTNKETALAMKNLPALLKEAGYTYTPQSAFDAEPGRITMFNAEASSGKPALMGMWVETRTKNGDYTLLAWSQCQPAAASAEQSDPSTPNAAPVAEPAPAAPKAPTAKAVKGSSGKVPADLVGKTWSWTTISGVNYRNTVTNQLASPSGMSARFTFTPDGGYDFFFFVSQRTYSLVTQSTSTHQGKVVFHGDGSFTMYPAKGHYKGSTGSSLIDRPMSEAERKPVKYLYEWRTEDGKRQLYIGPSKGSLSRFKGE